MEIQRCGTVDMTREKSHWQCKHSAPFMNEWILQGVCDETNTAEQATLLTASFASMSWGSVLTTMSDSLDNNDSNTKGTAPKAAAKSARRETLEATTQVELVKASKLKTTSLDRIEARRGLSSGRHAAGQECCDYPAYQSRKEGKLWNECCRKSAQSCREGFYSG